ncbi:hypothetical protein BC940DRAFT_323156 [Gongronella butleri]|nr:hypothetical protein BC940DRAFT_323156 [Gongronella butleri]
MAPTTYTDVSDWGNTTFVNILVVDENNVNMEVVELTSTSTANRGDVQQATTSQPLGGEQGPQIQEGARRILVQARIPTAYAQALWYQAAITNHMQYIFAVTANALWIRLTERRRVRNSSKFKSKRVRVPQSGSFGGNQAHQPTPVARPRVSHARPISESRSERIKKMIAETKLNRALADKNKRLATVPAQNVGGSSPVPLLTVPMALLHNNIPYVTRAVVDTGATLSFIRQEIVQKMALLTEKLAEVLFSTGADGERFKHPISHRTKPVTFKVQGTDAMETMSFYVISSSCPYPIILGTNWCKCHSPVSFCYNKMTITASKNK